MTRSLNYELQVAPGRAVRGTVEMPSGSPKAVLIFCHGFKGFKDWGGWPDLGRRFAESGYLVNRFTFSLAGVSGDSDRHDRPDDFSANTYGAEIDDLKAVVDQNKEWLPSDIELRECGLGVIGHSRGGYVALLASAEIPELRALVTLGAPGRGLRYSEEQIEACQDRGYLEVPNARTGQILRLSASFFEDCREHAERYDLKRALQSHPVPTLVVHGRRDQTDDFSEAEFILDSVEHPSKALLALADGDHTLGTRHPYEGPTEDFLRFIEASSDWFGDHLP